MTYRIAAMTLLCAVSLAGCGGGGGSSPGTGLSANPVPVPSATATPSVGLHTVAGWRGPTHATTSSTTANPNPEPLELGVPSSVTTATAATAATLQVYAADASGNPVATSGSVVVSVADGTLASAQASAAGPIGPGLTDVATVTTNGTRGGVTSLTVSAPGASSVSLPLNVYVSLGVESTPSRDAASAWTLVNGTLVPTTTTASDVYVSVARNTQTAFVFPYGYELFPATTPFASIQNAVNFTSAGTVITASTLAAAESSNGTIVFKTASGDFVKARVVAATCLGTDRTLCEIGATLDTIALPSRGAIFPY